jgi:hypothetical protein
MNDDDAKPWDRRPDEPARWFARFELFRLAGPNRSLLGAYKSERERRGANGTKPPLTIPESWAHNAVVWEWRSRAEEWDDEQAELRRKAVADGLKAEIERHRANGARLDQAGFTTAVQILDLANERLKSLTPAQKAKLPIRLIPTMVRAAAAVALAHLNGEAVALGSAELLRALDEQ